MTWLLLHSPTLSPPTIPCSHLPATPVSLGHQEQAPTSGPFHLTLPCACNALQPMFNGLSFHLTKGPGSNAVSKESSLTTLSIIATPVTPQTFDPVLFFFRTLITRWDITDLLVHYLSSLLGFTVLCYEDRVSTLSCSLLWTVPYIADNNKYFLNQQINLILSSLTPRSCYYHFKKENWVLGQSICSMSHSCNKWSKDLQRFSNYPWWRTSF